MGEQLEDDEVRQRVREAILKAGGVPVVAARTGIPAKTLENYLSKRSTPSLDRAAKIAAAAGMSVADLAGEKASPQYNQAIAGAAVQAAVNLGEMIVRVYSEENVMLPHGLYPSEIGRVFKMVLARVSDPQDADEWRDLMPWAEGRLRRELREAAAAPGTGKREVS